jgi:hypothetical protein
MTYRALAAAVIVLASSPTIAQTDGIFRDYAALTVPRADIPVGAEWIPGVGPNGDGASDNISVAAGMSASTINTTLHRKIAFGLGSLLGLDADSATDRTVGLEGIEIHRVKDIGKLRLAAGQQVLFEGIKAKRILVTVDKARSAQLQAAAQAKGIPITASIDAGSTRKITLDGSNLFLAYQVIALESPRVREETKYHLGQDITLSNTYRFRFCECADAGGIKISMTNLLAPDASGGFVTQTWTMPANAAWAEYSLPAFRRGNTITAAMVTVKFLNDRIYFTTPAGEQKFMSNYPKERNSIELRTTTFTIQPVRNPSATY